MKRTLLGLAAIALLGSCEPTTYGQAIQQQKRAEAPQSVGPEAEPHCPTIAIEGTGDYDRCEKLLREQHETGVGGSGRPDPVQR